jgi:hypothetical protein
VSSCYTPMKRISEPVEIARSVIYLLANATFTTGAYYQPTEVLRRIERCLTSSGSSSRCERRNMFCH